MCHTPKERLVPDATTVVVFIHGICGTPRHFDILLPLLPDNVSYSTLLLQGHGAGAKDFGQSSMAQWQRQVDEAILRLGKDHRQVLLVGHSLGSLLAIHACNRISEVTALFCMAVPLRLRFSATMAKRCWQMFRGTLDITEAQNLASINCCGITISRNPAHYFGWLPRFLELFSKIISVRKILPTVQIPCTCLQSGQDELVSRHTEKILEQVSSIHTICLETAGHYYYPPKAFAAAQQVFQKWLSTWI